jgi:4-hydroxy-3-polyprenylbenzoate decarboxylase
VHDASERHYTFLGWFGQAETRLFVPITEQRQNCGGETGVRIVVGITGASGAIYGLRLLERLRNRQGAEVHLVLTRSAEKTLFLETGRLAADVGKLADFWYPLEDIACRLASGSYPTDGMVIAPCSVHTMSAIANGISSNLLVRAADVTLKEKRKLILLVRESPLHLGHLRNMTSLSEMGAIIAPPIPGFYNHPQTVMDIVDHSIDRVLDLIGIPDTQVRRWEGAEK